MNSLTRVLLKSIFTPDTKTYNFQVTKDEGKILDEDRLIDLSFNESSKRLSFKIQHYHLEPKISRYVQRNYERFPVYEGEYSERTKIIKTFNKIINPIKFINQDILSMNLDKKFIIDIIGEIGIIPAWRKKEIKIENIENEIKNLNNSTRNFNKEAKPYQFKITNYQEAPSNFWLRLLLIPLTFGFSFKKYISKKQAEINVNSNKINTIWNKKHKKEIDEENSSLKTKIEENNNKVLSQINFLYKNIQSIEAQEISYEKKYENDWLDLKDASNTYYSKLQGKKGVYIIWNQTKNKYYVGQSKNMKSRLLNHFKDGEPKNIIFAKDFFDGDHFVYKYYFCETKDELDSLEKRYIEEFFSFENGYNKTRGNI